MARVKHQEIMDKAHAMRIMCRDVYVDYYRPGDGVTRYRFFDKPLDYFAGSGLATVLGAKEAMAWLDGFEAGHINGFEAGKEWQKDHTESIQPDGLAVTK